MYSIIQTGFVGKEIESTEINDVNPARRVVFVLRIKHEAEINHTQLLNLNHVDRQTTKLLGH